MKFLKAGKLAQTMLGLCSRRASCPNFLMPFRALKDHHMRAGSEPTSLGLYSQHLQKGLRDRNSPTCTLSQNGYGEMACCSTTLHLGCCRLSHHNKRFPQRLGDILSSSNEQRASAKHSTLFWKSLSEIFSEGAGLDLSWLSIVPTANHLFSKSC